MQHPATREERGDRAWINVVRCPVAMSAAGLVFEGSKSGAGPILARIGEERMLTTAEAERVLTLLSIAYRRPVPASLLPHVEAAARHWHRGNKALANFRLVFSGLPSLNDPSAVPRLNLAETLLDAGLAPRGLMKELGLDSAALDLVKYNPAQPRVPAGNGRESGRWGDGGGSEETGPWGVGVRGAPQATRELPHRPTETAPHIVPVAADGPLKPGGIESVPLSAADPLDPKNLNKPLSLEEQQAIADTVNTIIAAQPEDISTLRPHIYNNFPSRITGALLPESVSAYMTYYVRSPGAPPGAVRIIIDTDGHIFYTNNHYLSFYPVDIRLKSK